MIFVVLTFLKVSQETKCVPYFIKAKNEEKRKKSMLFFRSKPFLPFMKKNHTHIFILNFLFDNCSLMSKEGFCKFSIQNINF